MEEFMNVTELVAEKIKKICREKNISINKLSHMCSLRQSTIQSLIGGKSKNPKIQTIQTICDGLHISLQDFFLDDLFLQIERDEKIGNN